MPVLFFYKNYTFRFWSAEESRPHVHAIGPNGEVKFWLDPDSVSNNDTHIKDMM